MPGDNSAESPLDAVADLTGEEVVKSFESLGNDTRLAILLALWDAKEPDRPLSESSEPMLSFSELREKVGTRDSGQFNYHLDKLVGPFVEQTERGYSLTEPAEQFLRAVFAGTLRDHASFEGEPVDAECSRCGEPIVTDYSDGILVERCTSCDGFFQPPDHPDGILSRVYRPPAGFLHRSPTEFHRHGNAWERHRLHSMMEGVCPDCTGAVTASFQICEDHESTDGTVCDTCGTYFEIMALFVCDICKFDLWTPAFAPLVTEMSVKSFFYDRGLDFEALYDVSDMEQVMDAVEQMTVTAEDPLEITVTIELDGDRVEATLDEQARVIDGIEEQPERD